MKYRGIIALAALFFLCGIANTFSEEYRVLAIRVDFPYEEPDHDTTTGRGTFDLRNYYDESNSELRESYFNPWDVPPHNKRYFENHLQSLNNYWTTVTEGQVTIKYEIWPQSSDDAYTLSKKFYKYGNGRSKDKTYEKLVELVKEAINTCKQIEGDNIDFSAFDTVMIIHAGIGSETSGGLNDIPSAYVSKDDIGSPLIVDGREIKHALIVPEMTSSNGFGGLNGILAQMFGHRLGLPSLSNNDIGMPAAGGWCLMDTGAMSWGARTRGFLPTHPCAWSKIDRGWIKPLLAVADTTVNIAATHIASDLPKAVKIPISDDEYFLIENRNNYAPRDSLASAVYSDTDSSGVWMSADHYDAYIPGSGILIWRINDRIISENRADGTINDDPFRRGIDLIEADNRQDIGALIGFGDSRAEYTEGHQNDTFTFSDNPLLSPDSKPNSDSMWGGKSGITIRVNSDPGDTMSVTITVSGALNGFPLSVGSNGRLTSVDMDGDGAEELIVANDEQLQIVDGNGTILHTTQATGHPSAVRNDPSGTVDLAVPVYGDVKILRMNGQKIEAVNNWGIRFFIGHLLNSGGILTSNMNETQQLIFPERMIIGGETQSTELYVVDPADLSYNNYALPDTAHIISISEVNGYFAAVSDDNTLYMGLMSDHVFTAFATEGQSILGPVQADMDRDDDYETVITVDNTLRIYNDDGSFDMAFLSDTPVGAPIVADLDDDGYPEIIQCTASTIEAFRVKGTRVNGFPLNLPPGDRLETITSPPIIADVDNDGDVDILFATSNRRMIAYDPSGNMADGFPITLKGVVESAPLIFRLKANDTIALGYVTVDGLLMAHDLGVTADDDDLAWPMWKGGPALTSALPNSEVKSDVRDTASFKAFCYPNPVTGNVATFRIIPQAETDCTITVFTADGRKVFRRTLGISEVIPGVPNDITMNATDLASGLYIAKIETRQKTIFYKLGVLK